MSSLIQPNAISSSLIGLWRHLSRRRRFQFWLLVGLMIISALVEVVSLGAVLPFLGILIAPERVFSHPMVQKVAPVFGTTSADQMVLPLTLLFVVAALMAGIFRIILLWISTRFGFASGADLSIEVYRRTLYQPYRVHIARNSSDVISNITNKINSVVFDVLLPLLTLISSFVLLVAITTALFIIDTMVASVAIIGFGANYVLITWLTSQRLHLNSQCIEREQTQVVKALQEGLGGIRDVLLSGTQSVYCDIYRKADQPLRRAQGNNSFIAFSPRYVLESLGIILITVLAYTLSLKPGGITEAMPVLGALALGAQRMLPALQLSFSNWARITGTQSSLLSVVTLLDQHISEESLQPDPAPLIFQDSIQYNGVSFRYSDDKPWVLNKLNFNIPKGTRFGFIGSTGSGKSTALDLLMGLLVPTEGEILVDGQLISNNQIRAWQRTIAHVPQSIYLSDNSIAENIAFGVPLQAINMNRVQEVAQQAQISDFIENQTEGYKALVGERGIRISGGQLQRLGIARALYKQASVLVFDEATSALDNATENAVLSSIKGLKRDLTILLIAHRITTVRYCDIIVELNNGRVVMQGTFEELLRKSATFREMVRLAKVEPLQEDV